MGVKCRGLLNISRTVLRLPSLQNAKVRFDLIVRVVFVFHLVIDTGDFLAHCQRLILPWIVELAGTCRSTYFLKRTNNLAQWFICPKLDFIPVKGLEIMFRRLFQARSANVDDIKYRRTLTHYH